MDDYYLEPQGIAYRTNTFVMGRTTLVFIHGFSGSCAAWAPYEDALQDSYNIVTFDLRGHGLSQRPSTLEGYELSRFRGDIEALYDALALSNTVLISHSFGTLIALEFIRKNPGRVREALFLSAVYGIQDRWFVKATQKALALSVRTTESFSKKPLELRRHAYAFNTNMGDWSLRHVIPDIRTTGARPYMYILEQLYKDDHDNAWKSLTLPTRLVHGVRDSIVPIENARTLARAIPDATLVELPLANHILPLNNVADILAAIRAFAT